MTKYILSIFLAAALLSCKSKNNDSEEQEPGSGPVETTDTVLPVVRTDTIEQAETISEKQLILPGKGIGQLRIDATTTEAYKILGKPDSGDNAMGSSLAVWYTDHKPSGYRTSVFASHKYGAKDEQASYIKKIMVNSPWFKTTEGIAAGSSLQDIMKYFSLKKGDSFAYKGKTIAVYSDIAKGITFEIDPTTAKCSSIIVGRPNESNGTYLNMH